MYYPESDTELTWELVNAASKNNPWANTSSNYGASILTGANYFNPTLNPRDSKPYKEVGALRRIEDVLPLFRDVHVPQGPVPELPELSIAEVRGLKKNLHASERKKNRKELGIDSVAYGFADAFSANPKRDYTDLQAFYQGNPVFSYEEKLPILCALLDENVRADPSLRARIATRWDDVYNDVDTLRAMRIYTTAQRMGFEQDLGLTQKKMELIANRLLAHLDSREDRYLDVSTENPISGCTIGGMYRNLRILAGGAKAATVFGKEASVPIGYAWSSTHGRGLDYRTDSVAVIRTRRFMRRLEAITEISWALGEMLTNPEYANRTCKLLYLAAVVDEMEARGQAPDFSNIGAYRYEQKDISRREYAEDGIRLGRTHPDYNSVRTCFSKLKDELDVVFTQERLHEDSLSLSPQLVEEVPAPAQP